MHFDPALCAHFNIINKLLLADVEGITERHTPDY